MNAGHASVATFCAEQLTAAAVHYSGFLQEYSRTLASDAKFPRSVQSGVVRLVNLDDWTSGFPAGSLWLLYQHTKQPTWREAADTWTGALIEQRSNTYTHDIGFMINNTFGNGHRLTHNAAYIPVLTDAASSLASRFNSRVGATRSWSFGAWRFPVIIDNMMNLELLLHASELTGDPRFSQIALTHAFTTLEHHFRPDASSYHLVDFDPESGKVIRKQTNQGLADDSAWARGQAWGLYGYTMMARKTAEARFLAQAQRIADFYTTSPAMPADGVPWFDFAAAGKPEVPQHRDASAAAIAASALFDLARLSTEEAAARYRQFAANTLRSLASPDYLATPGSNGHFLLKHSVGNYPANDEVDVALNYTDYYYLEALLRGAALGE